MLDTEVIYTASYNKCNKYFEEGLPQILYLDLFSHTFQKLLIRRGAFKTDIFFVSRRPEYKYGG